MKSAQMAAIFKETVITNKEEYLGKYSKFSSLKDFDRNYEMIMAEVKEDFTPYQWRIINRIRKYACDTPGVAFASLRKYKAQIEKDLGHPVHEDTIRKTINKAQKLGLLIKVKARRLRNTSQAPNVLIFNRYEEVFTYQLAQRAKDEAELMERLEREYEAAQPLMQFAHIKKAQAAANVQKRKEQEQKAKEEKKAEIAAKRQNLYVKIREYLAKKKMDQSLLNQFCAIGYGSIKKLRAADGKISQEQAETIAFELFIKAVNSKNVKKPLGLYSYLFKREMETILGTGEYTNAEVEAKRGLRNEIIPQWMIDKEKDPKRKAEFEASNKAVKEQREKNNTRVPEWFKKPIESKLERSSDTVEMTEEEMKAEHEKLIAMLRSPIA